MDALDIPSLIARIREGDGEAFSRLVERHYDMMYAIAFGWCHNADDAADITQDACLRLARGILGFRQDSAFTTWLYRLVVNTACDWQRRRVRTLGRTDPLDAAADCPGADNPEDGAFAREILAGIDALPETEKTALVLVFAEGLSHGQAAAIAGCAETTISWRLHSARKRLAKILSPLGKEQSRG